MNLIPIFEGNTITLQYLVLITLLSNRNFQTFFKKIPIFRYKNSNINDLLLKNVISIIRPRNYNRLLFIGDLLLHFESMFSATVLTFHRE